MYVSSASTIPPSLLANGSRSIALRMRWHMNQADLKLIARVRFSSSAATPFLPAHIRCTAMSHLASGILLSSKIVPTVTENCWRHCAHFQTRRNVCFRCAWCGAVLGFEVVRLVHRAAVRAHRAVGPADAFEELVRLLFVRKVPGYRAEMQFVRNDRNITRMMTACGTRHGFQAYSSFT